MTFSNDLIVRKTFKYQNENLSPEICRLNLFIKKNKTKNNAVFPNGGLSYKTSNYGKSSKTEEDVSYISLFGYLFTWFECANLEGVKKNQKKKQFCFLQFKKFELAEFQIMTFRL